MPIAVFRGASFKAIFFFHFKRCIETSLHTKLRSRTCAQSCGQGKLSQSLCLIFTSHTSQSASLGASNYQISTHFLQNKGLMPAAERALHLMFDRLLLCDFGFTAKCHPNRHLGCFLKELFLLRFFLPLS